MGRRCFVLETKKQLKGMIFFMAKMKYWNGTTWETLDAKDADTIDGKHFTDIQNDAQSRVDDHAIQTATLSTLGHVQHAVLIAMLTADAWNGTTPPYSLSVTIDGDTFAKLSDPSILPAGTGNGVAFDPTDTYLAVVHNSSPYITIYKRNGDIFTKLPDPSTLPTNYSNGVAFDSTGTYLAVVCANPEPPIALIIEN